MSAIEESAAAVAGDTGKDIRSGLQPPPDGVHPGLALALPHLPYGDAVHAEVVASRLCPPEFVEAGLAAVGGHRVLFLRLVWPPDHEGLDEAARADGLTVRWSASAGWTVHTVTDYRALPVGLYAHPVLVADAARHFARHGLGGAEWVEPFEARWEDADALEAAVAAFTEREGLR
ncbi:hypothetical protein [Streptomyces sp. SID13726]|uniref:hypothetical protein n=1 Tax=Streptomyces sp. SID13726 TaxID=2706058 RepID=UPI0013B99850|nr:hypothetical protein [Streptomyces sp. SID13726]NEB00594.1 hypothetical protein [Streptomyces sp. SID13726]